jgi:hypothetical protein
MTAAVNAEDGLTSQSDGLEVLPGTATHKVAAAGRNIRPIEKLAMTTKTVRKTAEAAVIARRLTEL